MLELLNHILTLLQKIKFKKITINTLLLLLILVVSVVTLNISNNTLAIQRKHNDAMYISQANLKQTISKLMVPLARKCLKNGAVICYVTTLFITPNSLQVFTTLGYIHSSQSEQYYGKNLYNGDLIVDFGTINRIDNKEYELSTKVYDYLNDYSTQKVEGIDIRTLKQNIEFGLILNDMSDDDIVGWRARFNKSATKELIWVTAIVQRGNFTKYCNMSCQNELDSLLTDTNNTIMTFKILNYYAN